MSRYLFMALAACAVALAVSVRSCQRIAADRERLAGNQRALMDRATYYRTKDSLSVASVERLALTHRELEDHCAELVATCASLNVKLRRLQSSSTTAIVGDYRIEAPITPTVSGVLSASSVGRDEVFGRASSAALSAALGATADEREVLHRTPYIDIRGRVRNDSLVATIQTFDTIVQLVHRVPRKFLFIRWGCKAVRQEVISRNPHSTVVYSEYLELGR